MFLWLHQAEMNVETISKLINKLITKQRWQNWCQLLKCDNLLPFSVLHHRKCHFFLGFQTVVHIRQAI